VVEADKRPVPRPPNFLWMLNASSPPRTATRALDYRADPARPTTKLNRSTFRRPGSSRQPSLTCIRPITGRHRALKGPLHGGANEATLKLLYAIEAAGADPGGVT